MTSILQKKIDSLPPLPQTIIDLENYKKSTDKTPEKLLKIIDQDPLLVATLLKVANSAMFGFNSKIETSSRALGLMGANFTLSIAFGSAIQASLNTDLSAYGMNTDDFMRIANMTSNLVNLWISRVDFDLKEKLLLPAFLQEAGQFILSDLSREMNNSDEFYQTLKQNGIVETEQEFFEITTSQITASIFRHWGLDDDMVHIIEYVDILEKCPEKYKQESSILHVAKIICDPTDPLSDKNIEKGLETAKLLGFELPPLKKAIEKMQDRLLDE
jgi:HD-like signal output (HDOD) protein